MGDISLKLKVPGKKLKQILCFVLAFSILLLPFIIIPFLRNPPNNIGYVPQTDAVFLELWNINTFEGGKSSREDLLEQQAIAFQKQYNNIYIVLRNLTLAQAEIQLANGIQPDLVSFGTGAGKLLNSYCLDLGTSFGVRNDLIAGGAGKAVPWCMGGYVLCSLGEVDINSIDDMLNLEGGDGVLGFGYENTLALNALSENVSTPTQNIDIIYTNSLEYGYSQYSAYEDFLGRKFEVLLGTQRDFYRLQNRVNIGALSGCEFNYLEGYTDLVQWFSIVTVDKDKQRNAKLFVEYILSEKVQQKLTKIGMFSVLDMKIYQEESIDFEEALSKPLKVGNAFWGELEIKEQQENVIKKIFRN